MSTQIDNENHRHNEVLREQSPVMIEGLQDEYRREFSRRFRRLRGVLRETIIENDALRIKGGERVNDVDDINPENDFEFEQSPAKIQAFRDQLEEWLEQGVLQEVSEEEVRQGRHYTGVYVDAAYTQGLSFASGILVERDDESAQMPDNHSELLRRPINVRELEVIYSRNYRGLEDITEDIDESLTEILSESLSEGLGTRRTADRITKEVRDIQHTRARALARTEMLNAHNTATVNRYRRFGVEEVDILTHTPCPEICLPIEQNGPYRIDSLPQGGPPFHPNCVCTIVPA